MLNKKQVLHYLRYVNEHTCPLYLLDENPEIRAAGEAWYRTKFGDSLYTIALTVRERLVLRKLTRTFKKRLFVIVVNPREEKTHPLSCFTLCRQISKSIPYRLNPRDITLIKQGKETDFASLPASMDPYQGILTFKERKIPFKFLIVESYSD